MIEYLPVVVLGRGFPTAAAALAEIGCPPVLAGRMAVELSPDCQAAMASLCTYRADGGRALTDGWWSADRPEDTLIVLFADTETYALGAAFTRYARLVEFQAEQLVCSFAQQTGLCWVLAVRPHWPAAAVLRGVA